MSSRDMSETKDPAIKLFGRTIQLPETQIPAKPHQNTDVGYPIAEESKDVGSEITKPQTQDVRSEESAPIKDRTRINQNPKVDPTETIDEDKVLKRPDKILPCPRCNSFETKFCYFNNYNVNQPRHFCKNCQRYWTAGGTIRSVPVGAGRRKNKILASQFHQILIPSDGLPITEIKVRDLGNQQLLSNGESPTGNGTVLSFGHDGPLCESMANVLHLTDQKRCADVAFVRENRDEPSLCSSPMTASSVQENEVPEKFMQQEQDGSPHPLLCHPVPPWGFPCNPYLNNAVSMVAARYSSELVSVPDGSRPRVSGVGTPSPIQWCSTPMLAVPGFCTPNRPLQLVPASYFGCMPILATEMTNVLLVGSNGDPSLSSASSTACSGNNSPTLGKHCRDDNSTDEEKLEKCVLAPKTPRIENQGEALRSSIWASLGFKSNPKESESRFGTYKSSKLSDSSQVLEANPAHHTRSQTFEERV